MIGALKQAEEGQALEDVAREVSVSKTRSTAGRRSTEVWGEPVSQAQEVKQLRDKTSRLRNLVADLSSIRRSFFH